MDDPNTWMSFSEALEGYLVARDVAKTTDDPRCRAMALAEMRDCAAQMDYLVEKRDDENG